MMNIEEAIKDSVCQAIQALYDKEISQKQVQIKNIPKEQDGDYSVITFPFAKLLGKAPQQIAEELGKYLADETAMISNYNAVKGFCNLSIGDGYWLSFLSEVLQNSNYGQHPANGETVVVEYSSPNTNKPLHLGHIRNNLLGYASAEILKAAGYAVKKVQIINDRGVHICKSMLAWQKFGNGETPESSGMKGDHLVGKYYVQFEKAFQAEYKVWQESEEASLKLGEWLANEKVVARVVKQLTKKDKPSDAEALKAYFFKDVYKNKYFNEYSSIGQEAKTMLQDWEAGKKEVRDLWLTMNGWVYKGFEATYKRLGVDFDKLYYESETYLEGKNMVETELAKEESIFFKKDDGSTWIDLKDAKLDEKVVLRKDGTSMYITQDIGTANLRFQDYKMDKMVYVVGNEQDYHFKVLFEILARLGHPYAKNCHHLSYGMVNLTTGRMKSREGTVVDADDLMQSIYENVKKESEDRAMLDGLSDEAKHEIWDKVALGALKFYILKVESKKSMIFNPQQSIELQGQTGPYVQNAYVRTQAVQRKFETKDFKLVSYENYQLHDVERDILIYVHDYPNVIQTAAKNYNPADIANYIYNLAKAYHKFWNDVTILDENDLAGASFRLDMSKAVAVTLLNAAALIGIHMPDRM
ncbi:MAG: arginine--tRNA ligase [Aureispira sp.]|nr:arginine--tRNA ligase [Aureispira sp.]